MGAAAVVSDDVDLCLVSADGEPAEGDPAAVRGDGCPEVSPQLGAVGKRGERVQVGAVSQDREDGAASAVAWLAAGEDQPAAVGGVFGKKSL